MALTPPVARTLHDVGLAAWFGGSLMGVTGLNGALDAVGDPAERERLAGAGWSGWGRIGTAATAAHLLGGAGLLARDAVRRREPGVAAAAATRTALTGAALAASAWAGALGRRAATPEGPDAALRRRIRVAEWAVPVVTGAAVVAGALRRS